MRSYPWGRSAVFALLWGFSLSGGRALAAPDPVQLQQVVEPNRAGGVLLQIDRNRIATVVVDKTAGQEHVVSITMDRDQKPRFVLRCVDLAAARLVLEALRVDGPPSLDLTGRCRF